MRILVTGSSGTIGTRLCEALLAEGHAVTGIDRRPNAWNADVQRVTLPLDLLEKNALDAQSPRLEVDVLIHLAANARVYDLVEDPVRALENVTTTFNILEWARQRRISRLLFASSREVYGNIPSPKQKTGNGKLAEDAARIEHCESPYTASKIAGEALVHAYTRCYGLKHVILRFSNVYGMYDDSNRVVPLFIRRAQAGAPLSVFGGEKCLDFTYIDDTVAAIRGAIERFDTVANETYNIATGAGTTIIALAEAVKALLQSTSPITIGSARTGEVIRYVADITKAKEHLGYAPAVSFQDGIRRAVAWYVHEFPTH